MRIPAVLRASRLGAPIGRGGSSVVHAVGANHVVKFYDLEFDQRNAEREIRLSRLARASGVRTPEVLPTLVRDGETGRMGVAMTRLVGEPMDEQMLARPLRIVRASSELARAMADVHGCVAAPGFEHQHDWLSARIGESTLLSADQRLRMQRRLSALPRGQRLCHGDFHPGNVFFDVAGPTIIDWPNALVGNPIGDIARSWLLMRFPLVDSPVYKIYLRAFLPFFLRACRRNGTDLSKLHDWIVVNAAARVGELEQLMDMSPMVEWLLVQERRRLALL